jgi:ceramide glucosyltransferase
MDVLAHLAGAFALAALLVHLITSLSASRRCRVPHRRFPTFIHGPSVSIVRPLCGVDAYEESTLRSTFELEYAGCEVLFCCASADDPVVALVRRLIAEHPSVPARLLIGDERMSQNPKLNNVAKGWRAASHDWIVIADSNVLMPPDYLQRLLTSWCHDTGLVSAPPIGCRPGNVWAELECAYLNTYQARWQYAADSLGMGFAQGKTMLWRRSDLDAAGGIWALASEPAEDAAATKVVRAAGLRVRLPDGAFPQPLGVRSARQVWARQVRWARLRRGTFPGYFALEIFSGLLAPLVALVSAVPVLDYDAVPLAAAYAGLWLAAEALLATAAGWPFSWRAPLMCLLRELLLPVLWMQAWFGNSLSWRGNDMTVARDTEWMARVSRS